MLNACEWELHWLDLAMNFKKSCCLHIRPRCDINCARIVSLTGKDWPWVTDIKYLGIHILRFRSFKCSLDMAKSSYYREQAKIARFWLDLGRRLSGTADFSCCRWRCRQSHCDDRRAADCSGVSAFRRSCDRQRSAVNRAAVCSAVSQLGQSDDASNDCAPLTVDFRNVQQFLL